MSGINKIRLFLLFSGIFSAAMLFGAAKADAAASIYITPPSGTFIVGNTFTVSIYTNTGGQSVNAVEANLSFPPDKLQVISPTTGKSFIQVWVAQPTYSNEDGTLKFRGTVPTPGINTNAGLVSTVTFRVKSVGAAALKVLDSSRVLLNDGRGTDILGETSDGIYYLTLPPPQGPTVTSRTNPDQEKWYSSDNAVLEWNAPPDIQGYSYILDQDPAGTPDDISEGVNTRVAYKNLADGVYYFHIKALRQETWGGVTDYILRIDNTPPAAFKINFSPGSTTSNNRPTIDFETTDAASGLDHYELKIVPLDLPQALAGQNETPFFIEASPPYSRNLDYGRYDVFVRAYDQAGNYYQAESVLTITKPLFEIVNQSGVRLGGVYTLTWPYVGILGAILLSILGYFGRIVWRWHREVEEHIERGATAHPSIAPKLEELKKKQTDYGPPGAGSSAKGGGALMVLLLILAMSFGFFAPRAKADDAAAQNVTLEPPVITLFPKSISNDEIMYVGGRAGSPQAKVLIYLQNTDTGSALNATAVTDKTGAWFYSFPQFLETGHYVAWTQLKSGSAESPPSPRMDVLVAPTAIQLGANRLSYEDLYFILFIIFFLAFAGILIFLIYHGYHFKMKSRRLSEALRAAEESVRRGFSILRRDIEAELAVVRRAKLRKEFSAEEKLREERLMKDLEDVNRYVGKEVWEAEEAEKKL